ncbi:MAG: helix-turn-helix transcriptional regulator [Halobacteriales archaeon]|nr:helix-turn-helix transcriptional regulator [Halobacteriales archaeon]
MEELTEFQKNIVNVLVGGDKYGLAIKRELEEYYDSEVSHGRLYPNLDRLVNSNYIEKRPRDERTNEYCLTDEAREEIREEMEWRLSKYVEGSSDRKDEVCEMLDEAEARTATEA